MRKGSNAELESKENDQEFSFDHAIFLWQECFYIWPHVKNSWIVNIIPE